MKNSLKVKMLVGAMAALFANSIFAANTYYELNRWTGNRSIYVAFEQPVERAYVHITGMKDGRCTPPRSNVRMMQYIPPQEIVNNPNLAINLGVKGVGLNVEFGGRSSSYRTPQYFYKYEFFDPFLSQVNYKIFYVRNGQHHELPGGWAPSPNHCAYQAW